MKEFTKEQIEIVVENAARRVIGENTLEQYLDAVDYFGNNNRNDILNDKVMSNVVSAIVAQTNIVQIIKNALCELLVDDN